MDSTTVGIVGAICTAVAGAAGWFTKQGVDAWLKLRADKRIDEEIEDKREEHDEEKEDTTLRYIIGHQAGELVGLRAEVKEMRESHRAELNSVHDAHNECEKRFAKMETEFRVRMETMRDRFDKIEAAAESTNKQVAEQRAVVEEVKGDSKVIFDIHADRYILPDGTELDPKDPDDAKLIKRWQKRKADTEARKANGGGGNSGDVKPS